MAFPKDFRRFFRETLGIKQHATKIDWSQLSENFRYIETLNHHRRI